MTKAEICADIVQKTGIEKEKVAVVMEAFLKSMNTNLVSGKDVFFRGFGSFVIHKRAEKVARNIGKGTSMVIPAHNIVKFIPSKELNTAVKKGNPISQLGS